MLGFALNANAQTLICGNLSSQTWVPAGNPYIITCDAIVLSGQTLTIQPGVVVWIGSNVTITANGLIQAVGTPSQRIAFQSPVGSQYWNTIQLNYGDGTNRFAYCDFKNGTKALYLRVYNVNATMPAEIINCTFTNCPDAAIYGESEGHYAGCPYNCSGTFPVLSPKINNCTFQSCGDGCRFYIFGHLVIGGGGYPLIGYGAAAAQLNGNVFSGLSGTALSLTVGSYSIASTAVFDNNTVINCSRGVDAADPWDAKVQSCIFVGCSNAVVRTGSLSSTVSYNDFYANAANFSGYPGTFGSPIINNRNGTPCDLLFNIFQSPLFAGADDYHLTVSSPCVDAGVGDAASYDSCFPPSLGSVTNDIGAYGGPLGCEWITLTPLTNIFNVAIAQYVGVTINPPSAGHYRLEYAPVVNTNNWIQLTNLDLSASFTYYDPLAFGPRFYRAVLLP